MRTTVLFSDSTALFASEAGTPHTFLLKESNRKAVPPIITIRYY